MSPPWLLWRKDLGDPLLPSGKFGNEGREIRTLLSLSASSQWVRQHRQCPKTPCLVGAVAEDGEVGASPEQ